MIFSEFSQCISLPFCCTSLVWICIQILIIFFFFIKSICFPRYVECRFNAVQADASYLFLIRKIWIILEVFYKNVKSYQGTRHVDYRHDGGLFIFLCVDFFFFFQFFRFVLWWRQLRKGFLNTITCIVLVIFLFFPPQALQCLLLQVDFKWQNFYQ